MLRDPVLNTKRTELQKCVASRKRKLSELYAVVATVNATVTIGIPSHGSNTLPKFSKDEFLEANDLAKGRAFDINNLLRIPSTQLNYSKSTSQSLQVPNNGVELSGDSLISAESRTAVKDRHSVISTDTQSTRTRDSLPVAQQRLEPIADYLGGSQHDHSTATSSVLQVGDGLSHGKNQTEHGHRLITPTPSSNSQESVDTIPISKRAEESMISAQPPDSPKDSRERHLKAEPEGIDGNKTIHDSTSVATTAIHNVSIPPLTPDAQLQQEAAQFTDAQSQLSDGKLHHGHHSGRDGPGHGRQDTPLNTPPKGSSTEDSTIASRRRLASQDDHVSGMTSKTSKDVMLSSKPPMRIDTNVSRPPPSNEAITPASSFTPLKSGMHSSPPERMTTRVSSGALRHKSVSEILGETPKTATHQGEKTPSDITRDDSHTLSRKGSIVASPESASFKSRFGDREKDRAKPSTVVFARPSTGDKSRSSDGHVSQFGRYNKPDEEKDYLVPLFAAQAEAQKPTLDELIKNAHKTLSTSNWYIHHHESQDCRILKRIYHLQNSNRWSFRQIERSAEPPRPSTHWDMLLNEVKWMRTDFREERKWKVAAARNLAEACAEWVNASHASRSLLQIRTQTSYIKSQTSGDRNTPVSTPIAVDAKSDGTPELIPSGDDDMSDTPEELPILDMTKTNAPAALFSLAPKDVLFNLDKTPAAEKLLSELPLYQPFADPRGTLRSCGEMLDAAWRRPLVPVSKYTLGKLVAKDEGPPRKRSRYDYVREEETEIDATGQALLPLEQKHEPLPPEKDDVALFNPKNKHIIARLHAAHAFRPPSEFPMPSQQFFESRNPSQWTLAEDDELRRLVREYEYNWSMISACLSSPSLFSSGAERRTPWECFERWESFEGLPGDMDKHSYFRAWKSRRLNAKQHLEQMFAAQQQAGNTAPLRRRTAEPVHVERRRNNKHLALIHAMSKVAKKKETALQKQQHAASMAAMRKATEPSQRKLVMSTPRQFSDHKHKQELEFKEKQILYKQQAHANSQRALFNQKAAQQSGQQQSGVAIPGQPGRVPLPAQMNGTNSHLASSLPQGASQSSGRPLPPSQAMLNGMVPNMQNQATQMGMRGGAIPHGQISSYMQAQQQQSQQTQQQQQQQQQPQHQQQQQQSQQQSRFPNQSSGQDNARVMMEASRLQEQQRMMQQRQFQNQSNGVNGASSHSGNMAMQMQTTPAMLANLQSNGKPNPTNNGNGHQRNSSSPPMPAANQVHQLSSGVVPIYSQIMAGVKARYPHLSEAQATQMATTNLSQHLQNQNSQNGNSLTANGSNGRIQQGMGFNPSMNPQMYAHIMRTQQASQQHRNGGDASGGRPESRGATPKGSNGATNGASQSPRPPQAQVASTS